MQDPLLQHGQEWFLGLCGQRGDAGWRLKSGSIRGSMTQFWVAAPAQPSESTVPGTATRGLR